MTFISAPIRFYQVRYDGEMPAAICEKHGVTSEALELPPAGEGSDPSGGLAKGAIVIIKNPSCWVRQG
ncbi:MAG: hypothetical protein PHH60_01945 [Candidatus Margulisbacteria bacterium]|nr:hypothetical protein [Candidatus Margulisiibacteriota bacterium]